MAKSLRGTLWLKPGLRGTEIDPPDSCREWLQTDIDDIDLSDSLSGEMDFQQIFMTTRDPLASSVEQFRYKVIHDAPAWISFTKGTSGTQSDFIRALWLNSSLPQA